MGAIDKSPQRCRDRYGSPWLEAEEDRPKHASTSQERQREQPRHYEREREREREEKPHADRHRVPERGRGDDRPGSRGTGEPLLGPPRSLHRDGERAAKLPQPGGSERNVGGFEEGGGKGGGGGPRREGGSSGGERKRHRDRDVDSGGSGGGGRGRGGGGDEDEGPRPEVKVEPNFGTSGKLAAETNELNGVVMKFQPPPEARRCTNPRWRLYVFKGDNQVGDPLPLDKFHFFLFGKERRVADIPTDHPSCSRQHAVIVFREVERASTLAKVVAPYIIDLETVNGTYVNGKKIEPSRYIELLERDVIRFGLSSREYVLLNDKSAG